MTSDAPTRLRRPRPDLPSVAPVGRCLACSAVSGVAPVGQRLARSAMPSVASVRSASPRREMPSFASVRPVLLPEAGVRP